MWSVLTKELKIYFSSVLGYGILTVYLLIAGIFFIISYATAVGISSFTPFFSVMNTTILFVIPFITLRTMAEEYRYGTMELLFTSPLLSWEIVFGKFLASFLFTSIAVTLLLVYPLALSFFAPIEWGMVLSSYVGMLLSVAFFVALGILASSLTNNLVIAGILSLSFFVILVSFSSLSMVSQQTVAAIFREISYYTHYQQFAQGVVRWADLVYFIMGTFLWLYLTEWRLSSRSWK